jgi:hypothetical protein
MLYKMMEKNYTFKIFKNEFILQKNIKNYSFCQCENWP